MIARAIRGPVQPLSCSSLHQTARSQVPANSIILFSITRGSMGSSAVRLRGETPVVASSFMAVAGYAGTPLPQKLGIKEGHAVALVCAPAGFDLGMLPVGATVRSRAAGKALFDVVLV